MKIFHADQGNKVSSSLKKSPYQQFNLVWATIFSFCLFMFTPLVTASDADNTEPNINSLLQQASELLEQDKTPETARRAFDLYNTAAQQGSAEAQYRLAMMYMKGTGVPMSEKDAVRWANKSARQQHEPAVELLDDLLQGDDDREPDC